MDEKRILAALSFQTGWERLTLSGLIAYARENNLLWEIRAVARETDLHEFCERFQPHGLFYHPHMPLPPDIPFDLKTVYFDWQVGSERPLLRIDDRQVGQLAAEHFLSHGFTHFLFAGNLNRPYADLRFQGFSHRLRSAGYPVSSFNTQSCFLGLLNNRENQEISRQFTDMVKKLKKPLAVFAADDFEAYTVFELSLKNGWNIPEQVGILGANNDELVCQACDPMLSSIRIPYRQIGFKAAELLHRQFQGYSVPRKPFLFQATEVITRRSTAIDRVDDPVVAKAVKFIREHYKENITAETLLTLTGVSRSMLERRFKQTVNRTPYFEILYQRIEQSKGLLRDTRLSIQEIASGCGFNSTNRFCQAFKDKVNMTPSQYRQACKTS
ncbi:MAG: substrate-binding domain-containing protein [Kiritimatiellales bacterium]|jgi:LacI family transcriptional regulator